MFINIFLIFPFINRDFSGLVKQQINCSAISRLYIYWENVWSDNRQRFETLYVGTIWSLTLNKFYIIYGHELDIFEARFNKTLFFC